MLQRSIPAVYMRGGTSRALFFHRSDLPHGAAPDNCEAWNAIFCAALGAPDPFGRQLDGMGGGISSLSKVAVIGPPSRPDADVDYTFGQVGVREVIVGYGGNCGNISSAVGPFAVDEGLVPVSGSKAIVRIHNTNTKKIIVSEFAVESGVAATDGDLAIQGVAGTGAPIRLSFMDPAGSATGRLLPTGNARDVLEIRDFGAVEVSLVDASNPVVFVAAASLGLTGHESPADLAASALAIHLFEEIRVAAAVAMGLVTSDTQARVQMKNLPLVSLVAKPTSEQRVEDAADVVSRMISAGQPHKAIPVTGALCLSIAAQIPGSIVHASVAPSCDRNGDLRIAHASGVIPVSTKLATNGNDVKVESASAYRTARRLMEGRVFYRQSAQPRV